MPSFNRLLSVQNPLMSGPDVLAAQRALRVAGADALEPDGVFGPHTAEAVRRFRQQKGLPDGEVLDEATWKQLFAAVDAVAPNGDGKADPEIEVLRLRPVARAAAYALKARHPGVIFTSGRRNKAEQARAMSQNVAQNRQYIVRTYRDTKVCRLCQQWVDDHPSAVTAQQIAAGLLSVLDSLSDGDAGQLSRHLSGDAFDIQPVLPDTDGIMVTIRALPGLHQFLPKEAGLDRWHAEFDA
jgi:peptidoglycan hydrolase-like protein with peptidoglycan-binding domain